MSIELDDYHVRVEVTRVHRFMWLVRLIYNFSGKQIHGTWSRKSARRVFTGARRAERVGRRMLRRYMADEARDQRRANEAWTIRARDLDGAR